MKYRKDPCQGCKHLVPTRYEKCDTYGRCLWWPKKAICEFGFEVKWGIAEDCPNFEFDYEPFRQHFETLCDVMHGSEATPKNVLQSLGKEAVLEELVSIEDEK